MSTLEPAFGVLIHTALPVQHNRIHPSLSTTKTRPNIGCWITNYVSVPTIFGEELEQGQDHGFDPIRRSYKTKQNKINAPKAPRAPQVVFCLSGRSAGAGRSASSPQDNPPHSSTWRLTPGRYVWISHAASSKTKLVFKVYNHQKQAIHWQWHKYQERDKKRLPDHAKTSENGFSYEQTLVQREIFASWHLKPE